MQHQDLIYRKQYMQQRHNIKDYDFLIEHIIPSNEKEY